MNQTHNASRDHHQNENEQAMTINYLNSIGVAIKLASITLGAWQRDPSAAIAIAHRKTAAPVQRQSHIYFHKHCQDNTLH